MLPIDFGRLKMFDEVTAIGFPFSIDPERLTWICRGFKGHVVTSREMYHISAQPPGYELSFVPPPGLSGAPTRLQGIGLTSDLRVRCATLHERDRWSRDQTRNRSFVRRSALD